jgi:hypothetical protein
MKDIYEVLHQKEADLARVHKEIESLKIVAPLLADDAVQKNFDPAWTSDEPSKKPASSVTQTVFPQSAPEGAGSHSLFFSTTSRPTVLDVLKRARQS